MTFPSGPFHVSHGWNRDAAQAFQDRIDSGFYVSFFIDGVQQTPAGYCDLNLDGNPTASTFWVERA